MIIFETQQQTYKINSVKFKIHETNENKLGKTHKQYKATPHETVTKTKKNKRLLISTTSDKNIMKLFALYIVKNKHFSTTILQMQKQCNGNVNNNFQSQPVHDCKFYQKIYTSIKTVLNSSTIST